MWGIPLLGKSLEDADKVNCGIIAMTSLVKSRNSLQTGVGVEPLFVLRRDRSPVMLTCLQQLPGKLNRADRPAEIDPDLLLLLLGGV